MAHTPQSGDGAFAGPTGDREEWEEQLNLWQQQCRKVRAELKLLDEKIDTREKQIQAELDALAAQTGRPDTVTAEIEHRLLDMRREHRGLMACMKQMLDHLDVLEGGPGQNLGIRDEVTPEQRLTEANWESFPASDPPPFNPGHT